MCGLRLPVVVVVMVWLYPLFRPGGVQFCLFRPFQLEELIAPPSQMDTSPGGFEAPTVVTASVELHPLLSTIP